MDFPEFDNDGGDIVVNDENTNQNLNNNYNNFQYNENAFFTPNNNNTFEDFGALSTDPEELKRINERKQEEEERRRKLNEKISKELEDKKFLREKAFKYLESWENERSTRINKKKEFNNTNEVEYLKQRAEEKEGNINPWDKVISNIQLKEGEHKGVKDVSRMKHVILQRKTDFVQLKMK